MADSINLNVSGLAELEAKLLALGSTGARNSVKKGLRAGANKILPDVRAAAPVDTGKLRKNIKTVSTGATANGWSFAIKLGKSAYYGMYFEFGTSKMPARPFLRPVVEARAGEAVEAMRDATLAQIEVEANS